VTVEIVDELEIVKVKQHQRHGLGLVGRWWVRPMGIAAVDPCGSEVGGTVRSWRLS
jgi:hypothetical protein